MTRTPHGSAVIEFPSELEILMTRDFEAPLELVFDVFTKPEHVRKTFAPYGEEVTVCEIDLRVGGNYHFVMVTDEGMEMSFSGTYLEIDPPNRTVQTWRFDGWPDAEAVETMDLHETDGVTKLTWMLAFRDQAGRDHMKKYDGIEAGFENVANYLRSLLDQEAPAG
ncbi:MAG: SRPBCC domain-containing protein [Gaiellaceae bacterium]